MDRLDELATFLAIFDAGSLIGAARLRGRSAPAVTRTLSALEDRLGARLFERTTRRLVPTDAGRRLAESARALLDQYEELTHAVTGAVEAPRGRLRITAPVMFGRMHVLPLLLSFVALYPEVEPDLLLADHNRDLIHEGIDLAVRIGPVAEAGLVVRRLGEVARVVVASPDYLARRGTPEVPEALMGHDTVFFSFAGQPPQWRFRKGEGETVLDLAPRFTVNQAEAALHAARSGLGVTRVLSYQAWPDLEAGRLVRLLRPFELEPSQVHLVLPSARHLPRRVRLLADHCAPRLRAVLGAAA